MSKSIRLWLILFAMAGSLIIAAACGGDDDKDDGDDNGQPTAEETSGPDADATEPGDNGADGDAASQLENLAGRFATNDVKIAYDFSSSAAGTTTGGSMTLYWKPPDASRVDFSSGDSGDVTFISQGDTSYICSAEEGGGTCIESPGGAGLPLPFLSFLTDPEGLSGLVGQNILGVDLDESSETIAGQDGTCFSGDAAGASFEYCFSEDGVLLRLSSGVSGEDFTLEATSVEGSVSDSDVEPPYPVTDIGGLTP